MNSYYDTILKRVENEMKRGCFEEAMKLLEEELSMPYIPKEYEERIIAKYNLCRSQLRAQEKVRCSTVEDIGDLLKGSIDEQFQAVEQLRKSNIRNHVDEVREALRTACNDWVKAFLIEALIEQSVSEEFVMEREGLEYRFVPCALTLPGQSDGVNQAVSHLREWFENEDPSFLTFCVETLMQEAYLRLPEDIDESESLMLAMAVADYVFQAVQSAEAFDRFLQEHGLSFDADYELLLERHECSFG